MPDQERPQSLTDRELLLLLEQRVRLLNQSINDSYHELREQMTRSNARLEQMTLASQQIEQRVNRNADITLQAQGDARHARVEIGKLNQRITNLAADMEAMSETLFGDKDHDRFGLVQDVRRNTHTLQAFSYYARVAAVIFGLIQLLLVPIYNLLLQHYLGL